MKVDKFSAQYTDYISSIEHALDAALAFPEIPQKRLIEAMRYSLLGGGKRLRPIILLEFCRMCRGGFSAMPFACALEMVHVYSLIHDDLPIMDDDDERRGKPACHIIFGDSTALLAGSALLSAAFELISSVKPFTEKVQKAFEVVAKASGALGIAGGQELDLNGNADKSTIHNLKTAPLFVAAAKVGAILGGGYPGQIKAAEDFGRVFGRAFQLADDYSDGEADNRSEALGCYSESLEILDSFKNTEFMRDLINKLMAKLNKEVY